MREYLSKHEYDVDINEYRKKIIDHVHASTTP